MGLFVVKKNKSKAFYLINDRNISQQDDVNLKVSMTFFLVSCLFLS